jgi:hypothetical protein
MTPASVEASEMIRRLGLLLLVASMSSACGGSTTTPDETAGDELVAIAARWQCDRQRFAFDSLEEVDALLADSLAAAGVTADDYAVFEASLEEDDDLRLAVREEFLALCGQ